jgi:MFS family permease
MATMQGVMGEAGRTAALWRNRDLLLLWSGQAVSTAGTEASLLAFPLLMLALTHAPAQAGLLASVRVVPYLVFSLPAGALIDRWDRKRVMLLCDGGRALALGSVVLALIGGHLTTVHLYLVSLLEGTLFTFFTLAQAACLPRVVAKEQLPAANAGNLAIESTAGLIGPSLGGLFYSLGAGLPFLADAVSYSRFAHFQGGWAESRVSTW